MHTILITVSIYIFTELMNQSNSLQKARKSQKGRCPRRSTKLRSIQPVEHVQAVANDESIQVPRKDFAIATAFSDGVLPDSSELASKQVCGGHLNGCFCSDSSLFSIEQAVNDPSDQI
mmetsp:Transcript_4367/g.10262  ORF Transcript_4367/g.10262 Transcript_4367/m.10262 type:complete len:118 (-) Transcript_4367:4704-5057(-)